MYIQPSTYTGVAKLCSITVRNDQTRKNFLETHDLYCFVFRLSVCMGFLQKLISQERIKVKPLNFACLFI